MHHYILSEIIKRIGIDFKHDSFQFNGVEGMETLKTDCYWPGGSDDEVVVVFAGYPPLGEVQGQLGALLQPLPQLGLAHDLLAQLGEEVHRGQDFLGLLLPDCLHGARHKFWNWKILVFGFDQTGHLPLK